jgi:quinohemoprotein ethanol dehydrogenase
MKRVPLSVLIGCAAGVLAADLSAQNARGVDTARLIAAPAAEWLTYGRDYAETRYSPLNQITTENVHRLGLAWTWEIEARGGGALQVTPLVADGVIYMSGPSNNVLAVDARTGTLKWRYDPASPRGGANRGVALYQGKVFVGLRDGRLVALDAETGQPVWVRQTTPLEIQPYSISGAPRVVNGKVIIGNGGAEYHGVRGYVTAYDAETGNQVWRFYTVPGDPSLPFEHPELEMAAETWAGEWWKLGGGGTAWDSFSYDPEANLLYIGTGNGSPWSHYWRSAGVGDNLFLNSILAVNPDTGELVWYYQAIPAENWDYTTTMNMILADVEIAGRERRILMTANKAGFFYVLDRITGEFISAEPMSEVTWAHGYDYETGRPIETEIARYDTVGVWIAPGGTQWGGHNWHPMSWHPNTRLAYIPGQNNATFYELDPNFEPAIGEYSTGTIRRIPTDPPPPEFDPVGFLSAWDPVTNSERWQIPYDIPRNGGTLTTGENLLFSLRRDGWIYAHDATTGEVLWEFRIGNDPVAPITYELDGRQYVTVVSSAAGLPGRVWTFTLDGTSRSPLGQ